MTEERIYLAYSRLFFQGDGVTLKPEAVDVLRDLESTCHAMRTLVGATRDGGIDPLRLALNEGKRMAYLHIKRRLRGKQESDE